MEKTNRVWIELELPTRDDTQLGHDRAAAASKMLRKLGIDTGKHYEPVWFDEKKWRYAFVLSSAGSFVWASDHGHWFNLDYLAK